MNLEVVSDDSSLLALCREIARDSPGVKWTLRSVTDFSGDSDVDLCLSDYRPGLRIPENVKWATRCFVLVASRDLPAFRAAHPYAEAGIVLKPVTRALIRALMAQAVAAKGQHAPSDHDSIRSDRDDILQCLMEANLRLQQYDAERTNFLGRALHDFHAPLTALSGYCGLLVQEKVGLLDEHQKLIINRMHHSVRRLARMSRAMFQLSVGRQIALKPNLREADIRECVEQALYEIQPLAQEKELQLDVSFEPSSTPLLIDAGQIEQVMVNLLENACKFSPRSGSIVIKGYPYFCERRAVNVFCPGQSERRVRQVRTPNAYRIDIEDSGPGITPDHLKSIFEEYVSYSGGQDRSRGGLGLAISRMILNQHQGRIWAENGRAGAVFSFTLPFQRTDGVQGSTEAAYSALPSELSTARV